MKSTILHLVLVFFLSVCAYGQSFKLKGTVIDSNRVPQKDIFVTTLGSKSGHKISNYKGNFSLRSVIGDTLILITPDEIIFKAEVKTQSKSTYVLVESGETTSIDGQLLSIIQESDKRRYSDILVRFQKVNVNMYYNTIFDMLNAEYPDLEINEGSGDIFIRGVNPLNNQPALIIVDGVKNMDIRNINPQDVESISVVKDGTVGIYGGRSSGGVVIINTKKAQ